MGGWIRAARRSAARWLAAGLLLAGAAHASAEPALWVVKSRTATVYLFGTIHLLKPDANWETPRIRQAFQASSELWLEAPEAGDEGAALPVVTRLGFDRTTPLSEKLNARDRARLAEDARALGENVSDFEAMRPWLAAERLSMAPLVKAGFDPEAGVDRTLKRQAELAGRPVLGFETVEQQIRYLADLPERQQIDRLRATLDEFGRERATLETLERAWEAGDTSALYGVLDADLRKRGRRAERAILARRNAVFAEGVAQRLKGRGVAFVAVGAGHLAGPDGVPALLARRGLVVRRL
jgi:uncharacterized protein YbaP (TraB family)